MVHICYLVQNCACYLLTTVYRCPFLGCYVPPSMHIIVLLIINDVLLSFGINFVFFLALTEQKDYFKQYLHQMK
jgi:hypothetical protein